jgi:hypothetical protein
VCTPFGKSDRLVRWQMFATPAMVLAFLIGIRWGALGVAVAFTLSTIVWRAPAIAYLLKGSPVRPIEVYRALARPAAASLASGMILFALRAGLSLESDRALWLLLAAPVFVALYLAIWLALPGGRQALAGLLIVFSDLSPRRQEARS